MMGPAARMSGPLKEGLSDASASEKMLSAGQPRSRTAMTPPDTTAPGSESPMWTWRSTTPGMRNPSTSTSSSASGRPAASSAGPANWTRPPSIKSRTSSTSRPGPSHPRGALIANRLTSPHACFSQRDELATEIMDFVAQPGRVFEPEVLGGLVHLLFELLDESLQLL